MRKLILASGSARRKDIVEFLGIPFEVVVSDFPEENVHFEDFDDPRDFVTTIAMGKVLTIEPNHPDAVILGADTDVFLEGSVFGKPKDFGDARRILRALRGKRHTVISGVVIADTLTGQRESLAVESQVEFLPFSDEQLENYIASGEPMGKAGAYAIQMGARTLVKSVEGSLSNIVGLPIEETVSLLEQFDLPVNVDIPSLIAEHFTFE